MNKILGPDDQPISIEDLKREVAAPSLTGLRQVWNDSIARGMTPARLAAILQQAADGDAHDYLTLAEEMEERDPHYAAVLSVRKHSVAGLPVTVESPTDDKRDMEITEGVRGLVQRPEFSYLLDDLLDAIGKGYSAVEIEWDYGKVWSPKAYHHRDPRWFQFDRETQRELRLRDTADAVNGLPLAPYKFLVHMPRLKTGLPLRGGMARLVAFAWICKSYTIRDWLAFAEVFGMPLRLGRYGNNATPDDIAKLRTAVANLGSDAAAILPESMKIEFQEVANAAGGTELFLKLAEWLDRQISKAVLGQTSTTDAQSAGLGSNQASVHNEVRGDLQRSDARQLEDTLNRDLVRAYVDLNFGPQKAYPRIRLMLPKKEDVAGMTAALKDLVPMGLRVEASVVRDKLGLPDPDEGAEVLQTPATPATKPALNRALNAAAGAESTADSQIEVLNDAAAAAINRLLEPVKKLLDESQSFEEFRDKLLEAYPNLDAEQLGQVIGDALTAAQLAGRYELMIGV